MTTATTIASPLEAYKQGRDTFLAVVLDAMTVLEGSVLDFEHTHEGKIRSAGAELSEVFHEKVRLEKLVGEQALEIHDARTHVCSVPEVTGGFGYPAAEAPVHAYVAEAAPEAPAVDNAPELAAAAGTIAELREAVDAERRNSEALRIALEEERLVAADLRTELGNHGQDIPALRAAAVQSESKLLAAAESHSAYVRDTQERFDQRLADGIRAADADVRAEANRIIEAIAADNPALVAAADLFTVAFPAAPATEDRPAVTTAPAATAAIPVPAPDLDFFASIPVETPGTVQDAEVDPGPLTQSYPAPELGEDAILDPDFFNSPEPLEEPADESTEAPKPGHGLFGRKKETQGV